MQYPVETCFQNRVLAAPDQILVATDLTDADHLIPHIIAQAKASNARVTLFHAIRPTDSLPEEPGAIPFVDRAKIDRDVRLSLLGMARAMQPQGISCEISVRHGYPAGAICTEISRTGAHRLIMATHGRGKLAQVALGSVASELLSCVDIPIFVVGPGAQHSARHVTPRRILHPVSLAGDFRRSVCLALDLAQTHRAELTLLHVLDPDVERQIDPERTFSWAEHALRSLIPSIQDLRFATQTQVTSGNLVEEVTHTAAAIAADWIVLGVDGTLPLWRFRDTAAYKVLARAACPVLTIRHAPCGSRPIRERSKHIEGVIA